MPRCIIYVKQYGSLTIDDIRDDFHDLERELSNIGHALQVNQFRSDGGRSDADAKYLLANELPIVMVELAGTIFHFEKKGNLYLHINHFSDENKKFPELEEIAGKYDLKFKKTFLHVAERKR
ncbi:MAG: hypothetical protein Q8O89_06755 [Nanoarchaeota archaeon]|nr:hypothetical protein [Nanoarchaeota archaeon]